MNYSVIYILNTMNGKVRKVYSNSENIIVTMQKDEIIAKVKGNIKMAHEIIEERQNFHKNLSALDIQDIRRRYCDGETQQSIGQDYGISIKLVYNIVHLKNYKDVPVPENYQELLKNRTVHRRRA